MALHKDMVDLVYSYLTQLQVSAINTEITTIRETIFANLVEEFNLVEAYKYWSPNMRTRYPPPHYGMEHFTMFRPWFCYFFDTLGRQEYHSTFGW